MRTPAERFGAHLRQRMGSMTQEELAERIAVDQASVSRWLRGQVVPGRAAASALVTMWPDLREAAADLLLSAESASAAS